MRCFGKKPAGLGGKLVNGLLLGFCAFSVQGQWLYLSPWAGGVTGNLGLNYNLSRQDQSGGVIGQANAAINSGGFIYRPWILTSQLRAKADLNHNLYNSVDQELQTLARTTLRGNFQLYPGSDYPTELELEQRLGFELGDKTNRRHRSNIGLTNNYQPLDADYSLRNNLRWTNEQEIINNRNFSSLIFKSDFQQTLENNSAYNITLSADSRTVKSDITDTDIGSIPPQVTQDLDEEKNVGISYSQQWQHSELGSTSLLASYLVEEFNQELVSQKFKRGQLSSLSFLRSEDDRRLSYSLSLLASDLTAETVTEQDLFSATVDPTSQEPSQNQNVNTGMGVTFEYSDTLRFQGSANVNHQSQPQQQRTNYNQSIRAQYSDDTELSPETRYRWNANLSLSGTQSSGDTLNGGKLTLTPAIGHNINTDFDLYGETIDFSVAQNLRHELSDRQVEPQSKWTINHNSSFSWSGDGGGDAQQSNVFITLDDFRHLNDHPTEEQNLYVNFQREGQLNADADWGGGLTYEWRRSINDDFVEEITRTSSGSLWYRDNEFLGVPNLVLQSTLELPINDLLFDNKERGNNVTTWENRLDFRMGLLEARAQMDLTPDSYHLSISVKRYFAMPL